jgi:acyl-CoA synthetase (AMP-forming)/AMP-acid ligase II
MPTPTTFDLVSQAARAYGTRVAVRDGTRALTYAALPAFALACAREAAGDSEPGARVVLLARNSVALAATTLGLEAISRVRVPLNWRSTAAEIANVVADCEAAVIVHDGQTADAVNAAVATLRAQGAGVPRLVSLDDLAALESLADDADAARRAASVRPPRELPEAADAAALSSINYTSGTLGQPKGVMLGTDQWQAVYRNLLSARDFRSDDCIGLVGPLSHAAGAYLVPAWLQGSSVVLLPSAAPDALAQAIERERLTVLQCVPTVLTRAVADAAFRAGDRSSLRRVIYGAERMPRPTLAASLDLFGPILAQNYGLTEAMMTCCTLQPHEHWRDGPGGREPRYDAIGRPYPFVEIRLRRADGEDAAPGEVGELTVRSPHVMRGYWRRPEATAAALRDGWLWTGDLATWSADGYVELKGRAKDLVISGGMNIYPAEVEAWLQRYAEFGEVAVFGTEDAKWGERLVAAVVLRASGDAALEAARARARTELGIRCPKQWLAVDQLPRTGNGKLDVRALRAQAGA